VIGLKPLCEVVSQYVLPAMRALVAKKIVEDFNFSQKKAAEMLDTTQPAISQYMSRSRGQKTKVFDEYPEVLQKINELAEGIAKEEVKSDQITIRFCEICKLMVKKGMICKLHRDMYPSLGSCSICIDEKYTNQSSSAPVE